MLSNRGLFISLMRRDDMRLLRLALRHLRDDRGRDWREIREIGIGFYGHGSWMLETEMFLLVCLKATDPGLTYEDFILLHMHQDSNPNCSCEFCVCDRVQAA